MSFQLRKSSRFLLSSNHIYNAHSRHCIRLLSSSNTRLNNPNDNHPEANPANDKNQATNSNSNNINNTSPPEINNTDTNIAAFRSGATHEIKSNINPNVQKTIDQAKHYIEKMQADIKPILDPYISKMNNATSQLKRLTTEDSKETIKRLSETLNEITGYNQIDAVKTKVKNQSNLFEQTRDEVQHAKNAYESAIDTRSRTQRDINELLQRKHLWTGDDVTKFTELYRLEHEHSKAELVAKERYQSCEKQMDREYMELARSIMERYHEEQLWSDKIRSVSTYGTWALMAVNVLLFVAVQTVFEPRKRKRLTDRFEELLVSKVEEEEEKFKGVFESLDEKDRMLMQQQVVLMETVNSLVEHPLFDQATLDSLKRPAEPVLPPPVVLEEVEEIRPIFLHEPALNFNDTKREKVELDNEELRRLLLLAPSPSDFEEAPLFKKEKEKQKSNLLLYSIESAIAGSLVTAIAFYLMK